MTLFISMYSKIIFNCPICFDDYDDNSEIILDCSHKLCLTCYQKIINMVKPEMILCPFCRSNINDNNIIVINYSFRNDLRNVSSNNSTENNIQESNCSIIINFLIDQMKVICCLIIFILLITTLILYGHN